MFSNHCDYLGSFEDVFAIVFGSVRIVLGSFFRTVSKCCQTFLESFGSFCSAFGSFVDSNFFHDFQEVCATSKGSRPRT